VLVAQWDGFVWQHRMWDPAFLDYDYIGAPWPAHLTRGEQHRNHRVGNGGFSLRSRKLQQFLAEDPRVEVTDNEDVVICRSCVRCWSRPDSVSPRSIWRHASAAKAGCSAPSAIMAIRAGTCRCGHSG
jgi:hypothetical protein